MNAYAERCSGASSSARSRLARQRSSVCPGKPNMRSSESRRKPCARARAKASAGRPAGWMRPSRASSSAWKLCAPTESRSTPASRQAASRRAPTDSGFASSVISASGATAKQPRSDRNRRPICSGARVEGVPPPRNTELKTQPRGRRRAPRRLALEGRQPALRGRGRDTAAREIAVGAARRAERHVHVEPRARGFARGRGRALDAAPDHRCRASGGCAADAPSGAWKRAPSQDQ